MALLMLLTVVVQQRAVTRQRVVVKRVSFVGNQTARTPAVVVQVRSVRGRMEGVEAGMHHRPGAAGMWYVMMVMIKVVVVLDMMRRFLPQNNARRVRKVRVRTVVLAFERGRVAMLLLLHNCDTANGVLHTGFVATAATSR